LRIQTDPPEEIIVVWSGYDRPQTVAGGVNVVSIAVPQTGLSIARNAALDQATADIVAFIDDDAVAEPEWCEVLRACFHAPSIAAASGSVLPLNSEHDAPIPGVASHTMPNAARTVSRQDPEWFPLIHFGGFVAGSNMALRRKTAGEPIRFHPALGRGAPIAGGEEQYAFHLCVERGYLVCHDPRAIVRHAEPVTEQEIASEAYRRQRNGVSYLGFMFLNNRTARRALPRWLWRRGFAKSRGFVGVRNSRRLIVRSRLAGLADLIKWVLA
jgi:glycosyltransferase involved in cell wall biosynthesis